MKPVIRCLSLLLLIGVGTLAFLWNFGSDGLWHRYAAGNIPSDVARKTATERTTAADVLRQRLLRLGFTPEVRYGLVNPIIRLDKVCAALRCQPGDFHVALNDPSGLSPWFGDYGAPGAHRLYRRHFNCCIWTFDDKEPSIDSVVQVAVFLGENMYPDRPE